MLSVRLDFTAHPVKVCAQGERAAPATGTVCVGTESWAMAAVPAIKMTPVATGILHQTAASALRAIMDPTARVSREEEVVAAVA